jgi:trk system potassium uptake protein TrkH
MVALLTVESRSTVATRPRWFLEALFECISALATVGLSTGITPSLTQAGKIVLMVLMLAGRLGPITAAVALGRQRHPYQAEYLEEEPLVG